MIVTALEYGGGIIVVTARYLTNKWVKPLQEKFRKQGVAKERRYWIDRERRRKEAEAQGIPFDEPYPGDEDETPSTNGTANKK